MIRAMVKGCQLLNNPESRTRENMKLTMRKLWIGTVLIGIVLLILQFTVTETKMKGQCSGACERLEDLSIVLKTKYGVYILLGLLGGYASMTENAGPILCFTGKILAFIAAALCITSAILVYTVFQFHGPWWAYIIDALLAAGGIMYIVIWTYWRKVMGTEKAIPMSTAMPIVGNDYNAAQV
jgi:hypothetical protein